MVRYSPDIAAEICERLAQGESLRAICEDLHMPSERAVRFWVLDDMNGFAPQYARARAVGYERMAEEILAISDTPQIGTKSVSKATGLEITEGDMIEHRRLQVDTRKWMLAKMLPKVYGDRLNLDVQGSLAIAEMSEDEIRAELALLTGATGRSGPPDDGSDLV